ncbi:MAG: hypothetical protein VXW15_02025, partial [Bdellovibrionota bacterium]|nr:hypothetical protein [Bdellovibrionota bacterium]
MKNSSNPLLVASNIELEKKRLIKVGDVNGTTRSHLFVPDNIFGLSKTMLNSQAPELNCQSGGSLRHCLTNASNYNTASDVYKDVKRVLQNVIGTPDGLEPDDNDNASSRKTGHLGEASWILLGPIGSSLRSYIGETCSSLPISGINLPSEGNLYTQGFDLKMRVYTPQIEIPTRISSTTSLDYRVDLYIDNNLEYAFGFRCDNQTGWMRNKSDRGDDSRSIEIFYNTADLSSSSFDFYGLELYNYDGNNYRSKTALQFKKTTADSYLGHITKTTYNLSTGSYTHVSRYTVKSDISDNRMRIYHFQDEDNYPDEDNSFVTCSSDNCTSYCFTQAGDAASSGCPTISGSGDEVKTPALETIEDLSTESIDAGLGDGKEWNDLTPLTGDSSYNKAPKLNLTSKSMFVGTSYGDDNPAFDINDANTGNDFDQGNNDVTYQCEYKDTYSKTNNLASGLSAFSSSTTQTNDSLSLSKVYSVFYAHKASAIGSSTAYV